MKSLTDGASTTAVDMLRVAAAATAAVKKKAVTSCVTDVYLGWLQRWLKTFVFSFYCLQKNDDTQSLLASVSAPFIPIEKCLGWLLNNILTFNLTRLKYQQNSDTYWTKTVTYMWGKTKGNSKNTRKTHLQKTMTRNKVFWPPFLHPYFLNRQIPTPVKSGPCFSS